MSEANISIDVARFDRQRGFQRVTKTTKAPILGLEVFVITSRDAFRHAAHHRVTATRAAHLGADHLDALCANPGRQNVHPAHSADCFSSLLEASVAHAPHDAEDERAVSAQGASLAAFCERDLGAGGQWGGWGKAPSGREEEWSLIAASVQRLLERLCSQRKILAAQLVVEQLSCAALQLQLRSTAAGEMRCACEALAAFADCALSLRSPQSISNLVSDVVSKLPGIVSRGTASHGGTSRFEGRCAPAAEASALATPTLSSRSGSAHTNGHGRPPPIEHGVESIIGSELAQHVLDMCLCKIPRSDGQKHAMSSPSDEQTVLRACPSLCITLWGLHTAVARKPALAQHEMDSGAAPSRDASTTGAQEARGASGPRNRRLASYAYLADLAQAVILSGADHPGCEALLADVLRDMTGLTDSSLDFSQVIRLLQACVLDCTDRGTGEELVRVVADHAIGLADHWHWSDRGASASSCVQSTSGIASRAADGAQASSSASASTPDHKASSGVVTCSNAMAHLTRLAWLAALDMLGQLDDGVEATRQLHAHCQSGAERGPSGDAALPSAPRHVPSPAALESDSWPRCTEGKVVNGGSGEVVVRLRNTPLSIEHATWTLARIGNTVTFERTMEALNRMAGQTAMHPELMALLIPVPDLPTGLRGSGRQRATEGEDVSSGGGPAECNPSQQKAIQLAMNQRLTLIQGPPGTGKTHTIAMILLRILEEIVWGRCDDEAITDDSMSGGSSSTSDWRVDARQHPILVTAETNVAVDNILVSVCKMDRRRRALDSKCAVATPGVLLRLGEHAVDPRVGSFSLDGCIHAARTSTGHWNTRKVQRALQQATVVFTTCSGAGSKLLSRCRFPFVVIEEASQLPAGRFYAGALKNGPTTEMRLLPPKARARFPSPISFVHVEGGTELPGHSKSNRREAECIRNVVSELVAHFREDARQGATTEEHKCLSASDIAIITPYSAQVALLRKYMKEVKDGVDVEVESVDAFQGREKDVILVSTVRCNNRRIIGFVADERRMNVLLTRARRLLIVFGCKKTLSGGACSWSKWLDELPGNKHI
ncbi:hypothetical protein CYMTET_16330 [Cymbomonas tetramitiformis]|uniref:Uncharacterized protein n=1 Tax=Cymbomonas tetramitiformis TaxID=36881 RepID=A0AAE0GCJ7_9CHLO|nr:hypothetical protein CYMTET_16330 [Cymbomonas tetramitiformis]